MVQDNEVISLVLAAGVFVSLLLSRRSLLKIPCIGLLFSGYCSLFLGMMLTVLEGFFWGESFNLLEHLSYLVSALFLAAWVWCVTGREGASPWSA